jgi:hypothetical protein
MKNSNTNKQLMYAISNSLSKPEAISFAQSLDPNEKYFLVKVSENPKARHLAKRERYVVVRNLHEKEIVPNGNALFAERQEVCSLSQI